MVVTGRSCNCRIQLRLSFHLDQGFHTRYDKHVPARLQQSYDYRAKCRGPRAKVLVEPARVVFQAFGETITHLPACQALDLGGNTCRYRYTTQEPSFTPCLQTGRDEQVRGGCGKKGWAGGRCESESGSGSGWRGCALERNNRQWDGGVRGDGGTESVVDKEDGGPSMGGTTGAASHIIPLLWPWGAAVNWIVSALHTTAPQGRVW